MRRAHGSERLARAGLDLRRRHADVLEPELHLRLDAREDNLVLGVLEEGSDRARELGGTHTARIQAHHLDATRETPAVEVDEMAVHLYPDVVV